MTTKNHYHEISDADKRRVYVEQISLLYTSTAKGLVATFVNTFAVTFVLWDVMERTHLLIWVSANIAAAFLASMTIVFFHKDPKKAENADRWRKISFVRLFFSGVAFGSLAFVFGDKHPLEYQIFYYFVVGGMIAGATAVYAVKKEMFLVYACADFLPMTIRFFTYDTTIHLVMGGMGVLYFVILLSTVRSMYSTMIDALVLRFKNETLANRVREEKRQTEVANEQLTLARDQLWGEMQLAQKIQTVLLPPKPQISGYEITAYMLPADEIGGDYYDVINVGKHNWLVIGDVSGHGVSAGLVMMMAQTSIQTVLMNNPDQPPSVILEKVNKVIAKNIRKLSKNKYMTITVLAVQDGGRILFSGLHQDILVYRFESKSVESISTEGMWIGVSENLKGMVYDDSFRLSPGDTMLLFTDGVTEAELANTTTPWGEREMFGQERLETLLTELGERPCADIKNALISKLANCKVDDDMTFVIVQRAAS